jgi:hypothetical protein
MLTKEQSTNTADIAFFRFMHNLNAAFIAITPNMAR